LKRSSDHYPQDPRYDERLSKYGKLLNPYDDVQGTIKEGKAGGELSNENLIAG
jgi:hypothetical protein